MELKQTLFTVDDRGVAIATFNEPKRHNVMNPAFMEDLHQVMDHIESPGSGVRVLVLTGAGESFCAGGDLGWMKQQFAMTRPERVANSALLAEMLQRLDRLPVLTIARVNGPAYGAHRQ